MLLRSMGPPADMFGQVIESPKQTMTIGFKVVPPFSLSWESFRMCRSGIVSGPFRPLKEVTLDKISLDEEGSESIIAEGVH